MLGFLFGTACLVGLFAAAKHARWAYGGAYGCGAPAGWGFGGLPRRWDGPRSGRGFNRFRPIDVLLDRLEATPEQERAVRETIDELRRRGREARVTGEDARRAYAKVLRQESFDELALGEAQAKLDEAFDDAKKAIVDATAKLHGALDARQRRILAEAVEDGPRALFRRRSYEV